VDRIGRLVSMILVVLQDRTKKGLVSAKRRPAVVLPSALIRGAGVKASAAKGTTI
jgi:hypothetical protein